MLIEIRLLGGVVSKPIHKAGAFAVCVVQERLMRVQGRATARSRFPVGPRIRGRV